MAKGNAERITRYSQRIVEAARAILREITEEELKRSCKDEGSRKRKDKAKEEEVKKSSQDLEEDHTGGGEATSSNNPEGSVHRGKRAGEAGEGEGRPEKDRKGQVDDSTSDLDTREKWRRTGEDRGSKEEQN